MSRGFLTIGIDTDVNKIKNSYALALSIKISDPTAEVCIVVEADKMDYVEEQFGDAFDYIVELPFGNTAFKDGFHGANFWQIIHCTPFEETIYVDYDTLFLNVHIGDLWEKFSGFGIGVPTYAKTYRNRLANKGMTFETELTYELPTFHNQMMYFKRDDKLALEWFKMADPFFQNWRDAYNVFFKEKKPESFNKNVICNLVTHSLDVANEIAVNVPIYYDLDSRAQYLWNNDVPENATELLNTWFTTRYGLYIENSLVQHGIVHYKDEDFIDKDIIDELKTSFNSRRQPQEAA